MNPVPDGVVEPSTSLLVRRMDSGGLFVLADLAAERSSALIAVAVFDKDGDARSARLVFFSIGDPEKEGRIGQRLLEGALMLLRSDGIELVEASASEPYRPLLERFGFRKGPDAKLLYWL